MDNEQVAGVVVIDSQPDRGARVAELLAQMPSLTVEVTVVSGPNAAEEIDAQAVLWRLPDQADEAAQGLVEFPARRPPLIAITAARQHELGRRALDLGADDYLTEDLLNSAALERALGCALERRRLARDLRDAHELLSRKNERLSELHDTAHRFVDNISHEFRTPLTVVKEFVSIIRDGIPGEVNEEQAGILDKCLIRADDLALLVDDMLDISKLETGLLNVWRRRQAVADMLEHVRSRVSRRAVANRIDVHFDVPADLPEVYCDDEQIVRVIVNLVTNAIKFSGEGDSVRVWARTAGDSNSVKLGVSDEGPGINQQDQERVFQQFHQVDRSVRCSTRGLGVGLSIAKALVDVNLGQIGVTSEEGQGSEFSFALPAMQPLAVATQYIHRLVTDGRLASDVSVLVAAAGAPSERADSVIDEFLQRTITPADLVYPLSESRWLILSACPAHELKDLVGRLSVAWTSLEASLGNSLPSLHIEMKGTWNADDQRQALLDLVVRWCGEPRRSEFAAS